MSDCGCLFLLLVALGELHVSNLRTINYCDVSVLAAVCQEHGSRQRSLSRKYALPNGESKHTVANVLYESFLRLRVRISLKVSELQATLKVYVYA